MFEGVGGARGRGPGARGVLGVTPGLLGGSNVGEWNGLTIIKHKIVDI